MIKLDTETCGFYGMPVLLQYELDDHGIELYDIWKNRIKDTLNLLTEIATHPGGVLGFNLVFDWFQLVKLYTVFNEYVKVHGDNALLHYPEDHILDIARCEKAARDGPCYKPVTACDLFLHARKGKYQSTLDRHDIRIRKVPTELAYALSEELNRRIPLNPLYFARRAKELPNPWQVFDIVEKGTDKLIKGFKDIVLKFSPSSALKAIAIDALGIDKSDVLKFVDVEVSEKLYPTEYGWAPFAEAVESLDNPLKVVHSWPAKIKYHIDHWAYNEKAREYAAKDVEYLTKLYPYFDNPPFGDDDSILACSIAACRWRGYTVDIEKMKELSQECKEACSKAPTSASYVKKWIFPDLTEMEKISIGGSTKKVILQEMVNWKKDCCDNKECPTCSGTGEATHPAALKAKAVLDARSSEKEKENYEKIIQAGRFHASFKPIGALSTRMSGADGLNPQGIKGTKKVRRCFTLAREFEQLIGGDFEAFEVVIALAIYKDPQLDKDLREMGLCPDCFGHKKVLCKECNYHNRENCKECNGSGLTNKGCSGCSGTGQTKKKIHGIFGSVIYDKTYEEIILTKGTEDDLYKKAKSGLFSQMYGGNENTLMDRLGLDLSAATRGAERWRKRYPGVAKAQQRIIDAFGSMRQPNGIGSKVEWHEPSDFIPSLLGFRRYFTLENRICKELFILAENPPKDWLNIKVKVRRRDRDQTATGAVRSALFGAAFQIQAANVRAATNHEIQSTGAGITKNTQRHIWDLQPSGINDWIVQPMNIHDEIMCPTAKGREKDVEDIVQARVDFYKSIIPELSIDWSNELKTWADK